MKQRLVGWICRNWWSATRWARTLLVNAARGLAKRYGERLPKSSTKAFAVRRVLPVAELTLPLAAVLLPLVEQIGDLSKRLTKNAHGSRARSPSFT